MASPVDPLVGTVIDGRYEVLRKLARGGMATVYEALDLRLDRIIALKVMHRHLAEDPEFVARFQREARSAARLSHPHVVGVHDQGEADGLIYLAMEIVPGRTLRDVLREFGPLAPEQALVLLEPVLEALTAAHAAGFVHRDIKPENVLIADDGRVKVADFGLARALATGSTQATTGMIIGTVAYLSPEQVERGEADGRSDVYAAGILLYEMVTGAVPHEGESPLSVAYQHVNSDVPPPSRVRSGLPADVDALVVTATRRDPSRRYQSASDFLADVKRVRALLPAPRPFAVTRETLVVDSSEVARMRGSAMPAATITPPAGTSSHADAARGATQPVQGAVRHAVGADSDDIDEQPRRRRAGMVVALVVAIAVVLAGFGGWAIATGAFNQVTVPAVAGQSIDDASAALISQGFTIGTSSESFSETVAAGIVIDTDPSGGDSARAGSEIGLIVSKGPERYEVPDVRGMTAEQAMQALAASNLQVGTTSQGYDDAAPLGTIARTKPKIGTPLKRDDVVDIVVSKGPEPVQVPSVVGKKLANATSQLGAVGLDATIDRVYNEQVAKDVVISVKPKPGTTVDSGTSVALTVSKGPPPVEVPRLLDLRRKEAVAKLESLGLKAKVVTGDATPLNRVYSQDPPEGTMIPKGSTVTIRII